MMLAYDDFDVHSKVIFPAQNLNHPAAGGTGGRRPVSDLHVDHHALQPGAGFGGNPRFRASLVLADHAMRSSANRCRSLLETEGNEDWLGHPLLKGRHRVA